MEYPHKPVMVDEVVTSLVNLNEGLYVDGTVGTGGHSEAIYKKISGKGSLICMDRDAEALSISKNRLEPQGKGFTFLRANFSELKTKLEDLGISKVNGILLDLGMSSFQLDKSGRGFSFNRDEPLDMRMDLRCELTARELINSFSAPEIKKILRDYGEEKRAGILSKAIDRERKKNPINTSGHLADLIRSRIPHARRRAAKDPATRTFQALRIAVNRELENLEIFLETAPDILEKRGRLVFLTYHSLEDRLVKRAMNDWEKGCICPADFPECACNKVPLFRRINRKGIKPEKNEIADNPRARSAILRAAERI